MGDNDDSLDVLSDTLTDITNEDSKIVALFEIVIELDPLLIEDGTPKYNDAQRAVIADMQASYRLSGLADG